MTDAALIFTVLDMHLVHMIGLTLWTPPSFMISTCNFTGCHYPSIQQNIPRKTVSIGPHDPPFVIHLLKLCCVDEINYVVQAVWTRPLHSLKTRLSHLQAAKYSASYSRLQLRKYGLILRGTAILIPVQLPPTLSSVILTLSISSSLHAPLRTTEYKHMLVQSTSTATRTLFPSMTTKVSRTCAIYE